jgi:hypothetical protein
MANADVLRDLKRRFDDLVAMGDSPGPEAARRRGLDFESLLLDLFTAHDCLLRRSYHTEDNRSEQIDGAIAIGERVALIEAKWVASDLAASELFAFLGKVEGKFIGTIGVFISFNPLTSNFLSALRAGRRQSVLVVHGDDLAHLFGVEFPLSEYLKTCLQHVSIDNVAHLPVQTFLAQLAQYARESRAADRPELKELLGRLDAPSASPRALAAADAANPDTLKRNVLGLLEMFPRVLRPNIPAYVLAANQRLENAELQSDRLFFGNQVALLLMERAAVPMFQAMSTRLGVLSEPSRSRFEEILREAWSEHSGDFDKENQLAEITRPLWAGLSDATKRILLRHFVGFINSHRRPGYAQHSLARDMLDKPENGALVDEVLRDALTEEFERLRESAQDPNWRRKLLEHLFDNTKNLLGERFDRALDAVAPMIEVATENRERSAYRNA